MQVFNVRAITTAHTEDVVGSVPAVCLSLSWSRDIRKYVPAMRNHALRGVVDILLSPERLDRCPERALSALIAVSHRPNETK